MKKAIEKPGRLSPAAVVAAGLAAPFSALWALLLLPLWEREALVGFERDVTPLEVGQPLSTPQYERSTVHFLSQGVQIEAWLYEPRSDRSQNADSANRPPPVVIMAHGLGSQKDMGLHQYAEQFAKAGMAVLVFDYRGFGGSDGHPRHLVSWSRHVQDWEAALTFAASGGLGPRVDPTRVALWGISYSGGHVLTTASRHPFTNASSASGASGSGGGSGGSSGRVSGGVSAASGSGLPPGASLRAVVANEPYLTSKGRAEHIVRERGVAKALRMIGMALNDQVRGLLGLPALYIKLFGGEDDLALLQMDPAELSLISTPPPKRLGGWRNAATARMILENSVYNPIRHVHKITAPVLIVAGTKDYICPIEHVRQAQQLIGAKATLVEKPYGHIELHRRGMEPEELQPVIDFLTRHLE